MDERRRQSVTVSAKTVDEAIAAAERELGVPRDRLDITVITEGCRGFLGMRAENARILAMVVGGAPTAPPPSAPAQRPVHEGADVAGGPVGVAAEEGEFVAEEEFAEEEGEEEPAEPSVRAEQRQETARIAQEILETLLRQMDIRARVAIRTIGNPIVLDVETANGGLLIGRRGDTLSALQYIVNGHLARDVAPGGYTPGGTAFYATLTACRLGLSVGVLTSVPRDVDLAVLEGAQVRVVPAEQATTFENRYGPDGRIQFLYGRAAPLGPADVPAAWRTAPILHLGPIANEVEPSFAAVLPQALIVATPQGWLRRWDGRPEDGGARIWPLPHAHIVDRLP